MTMQLTSTPTGLDGIPAADTALSHVDGARGELIIAGERVGHLAATSSFEGVTARLWTAATAKPISEAEVRAALGDARERAFQRLPHLMHATDGLSIVDGVRAAIAALRGEHGMSHEAVIVGAIPVIVGALVQRAAGNKPVAPNAKLSHAADTLSMLHGRTPSAEQAAALDAYFVTVCDHGMNASTFTARVIASTQADLFCAVTGAYCALTGPLHGGAPEPVLEMLDAIGTREKIKPWIDGGAGAQRTADGLWPPRLSRARSARRRAEERDRAARPRRRRLAVRRRGRGLRARGAAARRTRSVRWTPMSNSSPRSCSMRWRSRARPSRRSSQRRAPPAGPRMRASSSAPAG